MGIKRLDPRAFVLVVAILLGCVGVLAQTADHSMSALEREIERLARQSGGVVGVAAAHIESGSRVTLRGTERFPMASTYKVPIAVQLLNRVNRGEIKLEQMEYVETKDLHPGSGILSSLFNKPGVALSVRNMLELMMLISDNSATDICLRLAGGGKAVTERMRELGITGIDVNRSTARLISDWIGVKALPPENEWHPQLFRDIFARVPPEARKRAAEHFDRDKRDTSTPEAMRTILERIYAKDLLVPESAELLLDIMRRCQTGEQRLKGMLPIGTVVAHKTGTIGGTTNDVGIITLPDQGGHVAIAVFVKSSSKGVSDRERAIADIARAVHDFFLLRPAVGR
jgi:beta-lactamase class A